MVIAVRIDDRQSGAGKVISVLQLAPHGVIVVMALRMGDAEARRYSEEVTQYNCALIAGVHNGTSPEQRRHAADKLADWSGDLRYLVAEVRR